MSAISRAVNLSSRLYEGGVKSREAHLRDLEFYYRMYWIQEFVRNLYSSYNKEDE